MVSTIVDREEPEFSDDRDEMFLGAVHSYSKADNCPWVVKLSLNREVAEFNIDTGADVTVVPSEMYSLDRDGPLKRST